MTRELGMNVEEARARAALLNAQLAVLERTAATVYSVLSQSGSPLLAGFAPGDLILSAVSSRAISLAETNIRSAHDSVIALTQKLYDEAMQQEVASAASDQSYKDGWLPSVKDPQTDPDPVADFWQLLLGKTGAEVESIVELGEGTISLGASALEDGAGIIGDVAGPMSDFFEVVDPAISGINIVVGSYDTTTAILNGDGYAASDGLVTLGLGVAGVVLIGNPVGLAVVGGIGLAWGISKLASGDTPVSKHIAAAAEYVGGKVASGGEAAVHGVESGAKSVESGLGTVSKGAGGIVHSLTNPISHLI